MGLEQKIGFDKIREKISGRCDTDYARSRVAEEKFSTDPKRIMVRLLLTDEMRLICMFEDNFPSSGYLDIQEFLLPLQAENSSIDLPSLRKLSISLATLKSILRFFDDCKDDLYPNLRKLSAKVTYAPQVGQAIGHILDSNGEVRDNASPALSQIRSELRSKEGTISKRIASILKSAQSEGIVDAEAEITVREGHVLIPVAASLKRKLPGIVFDESSTGKTAFVEPLEVIELNNQVRELHFEEQREIARILFEFTQYIRPYIDDLLFGGRYIGEIDFIRAKAQVALDMIAGMPIISTDGSLSLRRARHPLLEASLRREGKEIVPLTLTLSRDKHILLISGPNAGGKSVCLKTVGLLQYMFQWGMLIPTSEVSEMLIFDKIFIDIGDNQSLENDLSTYSSHLSGMKEMLQGATEHSLVLIDEFGSGTEPAAGGAIAEAILSELDRRGTYGVITTHYTNLKLYADRSSGVANGAMLFDGAAIKPLFKLEQGMPGNSFAFELARNIGLPESIIKDAEQRAGSDYVNIERNLRKIAKNKRALDEKLARIKTTDKTLESLTDRYQKELEDVKALKRGVLEEARREAAEIVSSANKEVERTIRQIKEAQAEKEKTRQAREHLKTFEKKLEQQKESEKDAAIEKKMQQIISRKQREAERKARRGEQASQPKEEIKKPQLDEGPLKVGDKVRMKENPDMVGEITLVSGRNVSVAIGSIISRMTASKLERISAQQYREKSRPSSRPSTNFSSASISERRLNFSPSIDIRGERLDSALEIVMHFIDDATMVGIGQVKILHGKGNGVLREEIRKYLRTVPSVASFKDEDIQMGGAGITVVEMDI